MFLCYIIDFHVYNSTLLALNLIHPAPVSLTVALVATVIPL